MKIDASLGRICRMEQATSEMSTGKSSAKYYRRK
jgi:hypothetical protein